MNPTPKPKLEVGFIVGMVALALIGIWSFGSSAYYHHGHEDLAQNSTWLALIVALFGIAKWRQAHTDE